ncbi:MAG: hypothetical protein ABIH70_10605 [Chloroflexota bacterium]
MTKNVTKSKIVAVKITSVLVFIVLLILPLIARTIYLPLAALSTRKKLLSDTVKERIRIKRRRILVGAAIFYGLLLAGSFIWVLIEVIAPAVDVSQIGLVAAGIFFIIWSLIFFVGAYYYYKYSRKMNPIPKEGFNIESKKEWDKKNYEITVNIGFKRFLPIMMGVTVLLGLLLGLTMYLLTQVI